MVFVVEGEPFYAHKLALSASSEAFRAMFDSGCVEGGSGIPEIAIPNLTREVFEAMMMFVYTGELGLAAKSEDMLPELLQACDLLDVISYQIVLAFVYMSQLCRQASGCSLAALSVMASSSVETSVPISLCH